MREERSPLVRALWAATILLSFIGVAAVLRRALALLAPGVMPATALDTGFERHRLLTLMHIVPGAIFVTLGPLQFVRSLRGKMPRLHRWTGRVVIASGLVVGATALTMSPQMAIGGLSEAAATTFYGVLFLFALLKGLRAIRRGEIAAHREWMIRAFAIGLAVATVRPIVGFFFATSRLTGLTPREFFGAAFWLGFSIQTIAAEAWIQHTRPRASSAVRNSAAA